MKYKYLCLKPSSFKEFSVTIGLLHEICGKNSLIFLSIFLKHFAFNMSPFQYNGDFFSFSYMPTIFYSVVFFSVASIYFIDHAGLSVDPKHANTFVSTSNLFFQASLEQSVAASSRLAELEKENTNIKVCNTYRYLLSQKSMQHCITVQFI